MSQVAAFAENRVAPEDVAARGDVFSISNIPAAARVRWVSPRFSAFDANA
ncbi:hypothetical protein J5226_18025 [Lysobacter sp. K5869]|nr:hypothetical protein [Lysobacter sp. K5869]QWP75498.1 hypothetical protein J5226_18025 [Lysobacter sp. K5869]